MHKKERRIIYLITILCLSSLLANHMIPHLIDPSFATTEDIEKTIDSFRAKQKEKTKNLAQKQKKIEKKKAKIDRKVHHSTEVKEKQETKYHESTYPAIQAFPFDPNKVSVEELKSMKLAPFLATRINNYRNKGGQFREKEDLKKIYGITDSIFQILAPFIKIVPAQKSNYSSELATISFVEINTATAEDFQALKGIGPVLSARIIKYRDILGGFHRLDQLAETYGLPDSTFQKIRAFLLLDEAPQTININEADITDLKKHPYIDYHLAKLLVNYRKQHGKYSSVEGIKKIKIITANKFEKIAPYLNV